MFIVKYRAFSKEEPGDWIWHQLFGFFTQNQAQVRADELNKENVERSAHVIELAIKDEVK